MAADSFKQNLERATNEVRRWPTWKRTLLGAATPEDAKEKRMATDQERNARIAEALGTWETWVPADSVFTLGHWESGLYNLKPDSIVRFNGSYEYVWLPDFSLPEWQIKIQEMVRKQVLVREDDELIIRYCRSCVILGKVNSVVTFQADTDREAYENYLIWLHERKLNGSV